MALKVYNTLARKLEEFKPNKDKKVRMFVCGPTVYDFSHIGHAKTYVAFDVIARYLRYKGYDVYYIQNITDIDDKIIERANKTGEDPLELSEKFYKEHLADMKSLQVTSVNKYAKASDYIPQIIEQVQGLIKKSFAYEISDGVYYNVRKFKDYGKLSKKSSEDVKKARIEPNPEKKNPEDFSLWKKAKPGEPAWDSPWGAGRPGWHIEDTAITISEFGPQYDLHGGGEDLIFPHHEAEIAQAEAFTGKKPFVKYWLHSGFLKVNDEKMSKSLGNFVTIRDALKEHDAQTLRLFFALAPHGQPVNYSEKGLEEAEKQLEKVRHTIDNLRFLLEKARGGGKKIDLDAFRVRFVEVMDNNFGTSDAVAVIFEFVREINDLVGKDELQDKKTIKSALELLAEFGGVLGLDFAPKKLAVPKEVAALAVEREKARAAKDWKKADELRDRIRSLGWLVSDTPEGPKIEKL